jgi:hypothetical protein
MIRAVLSGDSVAGQWFAASNATETRVETKWNDSQRELASFSDYTPEARRRRQFSGDEQ